MMIINVIVINDGAYDEVFRLFWLSIGSYKNTKIFSFYRYVNDISTLDNWRLVSCIRLQITLNYDMEVLCQVLIYCV